MNTTELAKAMLKWGELQEQAKELEAEITDAVLAIGKTQTVGNVRATYSKGRTTYDYQGAVEALGLHPSELEEWEKVSYDWKSACDALSKEYDLHVPAKSQSGPTVRVKVVA